MDNIPAKRFISAVCRIIEHLSKAELTKSGYRLVCNYLEEAGETTYSGCARYAVNKYISKEIPTLEEIREKHKTAGMDELDDLVLQMEYEARQLESYHRP